MDLTLLVIFSGGLAGGLVSGLSGFGTGLAALPIWLLVIDPIAAAPLVAICSIAAHLVTLPAIRHAVDWPRLQPFVIGGLIGVPPGVFLLARVPAVGIRLFLGGFLVLFCTAMLARRRIPRLVTPGAVFDGGVGLCGGILGGLAGLSGPLPTLWVSLRGWSKDQRRAVFQLYNFAMLGLALLLMYFQGLVSGGLAGLVLAALPGSFAGAWLGRRLYARIADDRFDRLVLVLLLLSGLTIIAGGLAR